MNIFGSSKPKAFEKPNEINLSKASNITDSSSFINNTSILTKPNNNVLSPIEETSPKRIPGKSRRDKDPENKHEINVTNS